MYLLVVLFIAGGEPVIMDHELLTQSECEKRLKYHVDHLHNRGRGLCIKMKTNEEEPAD